MVGLRRPGRYTISVAIGVATMAFAAPARAEDAVCPAVWPPRAPASAVSLLDPAGLLALRDVSEPAPGSTGTSPLAVSPDGRHLAFFITQQVPEADDVCETLVVLDVSTPPHARTLDSGGRGIRYEEVLRGVRHPSGVFEVNVPMWSPDGDALVYRKRVSGIVQVWRARLDGGPPQQLTHATEDVEAVAWSEDCARVLYSTRPGRSTFRAAREAEARKGYLYDARILPHLGAEPQLPDDLPEVVMALPAEGGSDAPASPADRAHFAPPKQTAYEIEPAQGPDGREAGADPVDSGYAAPLRVWAQRGHGERIACKNTACTGALRDVWWNGHEVMFLKRDGWHREDSVIQAWSPERGGVRTLLRTGEHVSGCVPAQGQVLCLAESSRRPRRIIAIDAASGREREFFEPNPDVDTAALPQVVRLRWRNSLGLPAWADLVVPPGSPPPSGWPLVIVQYRSDGFLRGGTGDEYPIFPLAARGIAVFSFQRPDLVDDGKSSGVTAMMAAVHRNWADRRSVQDSLMKGLDLAIARGNIDPRRLGITGLSDGSTTARFALINSDRFAAASISSCCLEPFSIMALGGLAQADWFRQMGFPDASRPNPAFWRLGSMALNAERMHTPLLMQLPDDEYIQSLETFTALREHGPLVVLYVFPFEHHVKLLPLHRAAIYERNLDWFSFWLQGRTDPDPAKTAQYARWAAMKRDREAGASAP
jgi:dipeptidyl aminopeptidase/acylaminoacyl peptidase